MDKRFELFFSIVMALMFLGVLALLGLIVFDAFGDVLSCGQLFCRR